MIFFLPNYSRPAALCLLQEQLQKQYAVLMKHLRLLPNICFKRIGIPVCMERTSQYLPGLAVATVVINGGNQVEKFRVGTSAKHLSSHFFFESCFNTVVGDKDQVKR